MLKRSKDVLQHNTWLSTTLTALVLFKKHFSGGLKLELLETGYTAGASPGLPVSKLAALQVGLEWARGNNIKNPRFSLPARDKSTTVGFV